MEIIKTDTGEERTFVLVYEPGEEFVDVLTRFVHEHDIDVASFSAIGGFQELSLGFFNLETRGFDEIPGHDDQVEVLSLDGEITWKDGEPYVHGHVVVGRRDGSTRGGHLLRGVVRPILIVNINELKHHHGRSHH